MGYALKRVLNGVRKIVHGEDAPLRALTVMLDIADAVEDGVAHIEVAGGKVYLCAQGVFSLGEFAVSHAAKEVEAFLDGPVPVRTYRGLCNVAAVFPELLRRQLAYIGKTFFYKLDRVFIGLLKIIRAVEEAVAPVKAQPVDILLYGVDVLGVLLGGVCVIHAQVA